MGLDTSHGCWSGAYPAFTRWRNKLAEVAGYSLYNDEGYETALIDWGHITNDQLYGKWEKTPDDPLIVLIAHCDCEGRIYPEQAAPLAKRLQELLPLLKDQDGGGHIGDYTIKTQEFIDGLLDAVERNENVDFY